MANVVRGNVMEGVTAVYLAVAWIAFSLRVYVKARMMRAFGWDDWLMVLTILLFTADSGLLIAIGKDIREEEKSMYIIYQVFQFAGYTLTNVFLKMSLALTFNRILLEKWQRNAVIVVVLIHTAFGVATFFTQVFRCGNPMHFYSNYLSSQCLSWQTTQAMQFTNSTINSAADWLLTLIPIIALRSMKMNHQIRVSVILILVLGCISSTMSMPRFGFIRSLGGTGEYFWKNAYPVAMLGAAELGTGIMAACLLTLRPLIRSWRERSHSPTSPRTDDVEYAEFGEAKAITIQSVSASSDNARESLHKIKSIQAIVVSTEVDESPLPSPAGSEMRRRASVAAALVADNNSFDNVSLEDNSTPAGQELSHQITADYPTVKPWQKKPEPSQDVSRMNKKRLTWNDVHAQWSNLHASRTAYHGETKPKAKRISMKRLTMLFPNWKMDEEE